MLTRVSLGAGLAGRLLVHYRLPGSAGHRALWAKMWPYKLPSSGNQRPGRVGRAGFRHRGGPGEGLRVDQRLPGPDLAAIASAASREAGGVPVGLLGDYLPAAAEAAAGGRRLTAAELSGYGRSGEQAALSGVALRGLVDLFLSATWRLWRGVPAGPAPPAGGAVGLAVLGGGE